jgi:hypothetical protein
MARYKLDTDNAGCDEILLGDSIAEVTQDVLNRYERDRLPEGWTITEMELRIYADMEYNAESFWEIFSERFTNICEPIRDNGSSTVTSEEWEAIKQLKGFGDGPSHARFALIESQE